jgi:hypothetical protein
LSRSCILITTILMLYGEKLGLDAKVFCDSVNAPKIARDGLAIMRATPCEPIPVGPFTVTALPAVAGLCDPQISFLEGRP